MDDVSVVGVMKKSRKRRQADMNTQLKALRARVAVLERASKAAASRRSAALTLLPKQDDVGEARRKALAEYYEQREIERYLKNPDYLRIAIECENDRNEFLKSRGLPPDPSNIPAQFRRGLRGYQPRTKKPASP